MGSTGDVLTPILLKQSVNDSTNITSDPKQALEELIATLGKDEKLGDKHAFVLHLEATNFLILFT